MSATPRNQLLGLGVLSPRVFLGNFSVALSVFVYSAAAGLLPGPLFGTFVNRAAWARARRRKEGR